MMMMKMVMMVSYSFIAFYGLQSISTYLTLFTLELQKLFPEHLCLLSGKRAWQGGAVPWGGRTCPCGFRAWRSPATTAETASWRRLLAKGEVQTELPGCLFPSSQAKETRRSQPQPGDMGQALSQGPSL